MLLVYIGNIFIQFLEIYIIKKKIKKGMGIAISKVQREVNYEIYQNEMQIVWIRFKSAILNQLQKSKIFVSLLLNNRDTPSILKFDKKY